MLKHVHAVKPALYWGCVILLAQACATPALISHSNYLAKDLPVERFDQLRRKIEKDTGQTLQTRGEAHVTVITPPEWDLLKDKLTMPEIEYVARKHDMGGISLDYLCVGHGEKMEAGHVLKTYFVVVHSDELVQLRKEIQALHGLRGGKPGFEAAHFYPHVTVGFTDRDLHEQDGVIKDKQSCDPKWKF